MGNSTLDDKIENAKIEKELRYPLMRVKDNLTEIRLIGEAAQDYIVKLNPEIKRPGRWEAIPQITMDFLEAVFKYLGERKRTDVSEVYLDLGNIMRASIEYAITETNGDGKNGTLNPKIVVGSDMKLETSEYDDDLTFDQAEILVADGCENLPIQFFDNRKVIKEISIGLLSKLMTNSGIKITDRSWTLVPCAFVAFFRCAKKWLIDHKDDGPCGIEINVGGTVFIGIAKEGSDDDLDYYLYITPGQVFKCDYAKGDDKTES